MIVDKNKTMTKIRLINRIFIIIFLLFFISCDNNPPLEEPKKFEIIYNLDGGIYDNLVYQFIEGEQVILPIPTKEGFDFIGWYELNENKEKVYFEKITEERNHSLIAEWEIKEVVKKDYHIVFNDSEINDLIIKEGELLIKPEDPFKEGYAFIGWYLDEALTEEYDFSNPIVNDLNLYPKWEKIEIFELILLSLPEKTDYYNDEVLELKGLRVILKSYKTTIDITDYEVIYNNLGLGENTITVKYLEYSTSFTVNIVEREKEKLIEYQNYFNKTIDIIDYSSYKLEIKNILFSQTRDANTIIAFNEKNFVKTNIYGYEILLDEYGKIIDKDINVDLKEKCTIISAHGNRVKELKDLEIGDYTILISGALYIYDGDNISKANYLYLKFYEILDQLKNIENIKRYNEIVIKLNNIIPYLNTIYNQNDYDVDDSILNELTNELRNINIEEKDIYNHSHTYSYNDNVYDLYDFDDSGYDMYQLHSTYTGTYAIGGFRNQNSIHYYDANCYRERNSYGYEIAIDNNGIVVEKDTLVNLPDGGYILSGHTSGADYLINTVQLYDKIVLTSNTFEVYRDNIKTMQRLIYEELNQLILEVNLDKKNKIDHDYEYIDEIFCLINEKLEELTIEKKSIYTVSKLQKIYETLLECIALGYSQLIYNDMDQTRGIWYYPFTKYNTYDDSSLEGIRKTMQTFKKMGINEIIINPFYGSFALFENSIYELSDVLNKYTYGEYGNDYLKCFITEAHKVGIKVNAFTQTFANNSNSFKDKSNCYYQIDYQGEKSLGSINYYDICNDEIQEILLIWYKELVTKYDFDKIEYDIIRYPSSNLYKYIDVDVIPDNIIITDHGYSEYSINKFMTEFGYVGDLRELIRTSKEVRINWLFFKERELVSFITRCTNLIKSIDPTIEVTAAVFNDYENAKNSYLQDYKKWLELGIVDEIEPMVYTVSITEVKERINYYKNILPEYNIRIGLSPRLDTRDVIIDLKQIILASKYNGYVLFANNLYYDDEFIKLMGLSHHYDANNK